MSCLNLFEQFFKNIGTMYKIKYSDPQKSVRRLGAYWHGY